MFLLWVVCVCACAAGALGAAGALWPAGALGALGAAGAAGAAGALWARGRWLETRAYWARRGLPTEPRGGPHPVLGSLTFINKKNVGEWMRATYRSHGGAWLVGAWWCWRPVLVVNCPVLARDVLLSAADHFRDHSFGPSAAHDPVGALNVFMVKEPVWSWVRRRLTALFTSAKLRALHPALRTNTKHLVQRIRNDLDNERHIELKSLMADFSTDLIEVVSLGGAGEATLTGDSALRRVTRDLQHFDVFRGFAWAAIFLFPEIVNIFRFTMFPRRSMQLFRRLYAAALQRRGGYDAPDTGDMFDVLRRMRDDQLATESVRGAGDALLVAQALIMVQGGFDTTSSILSFTLYEIAYNEHVQEKLYQELLETKEKLGHDEFDLATLSSLTYLGCVLKESLRKYPPMGWLDRECTRAYRLGGVELAAGARVYVNAIGMHYDPAYFPDPDRFHPERFHPDNEHNIRPFTFLPFGEGPRNCIGMRFAHASMRYALSGVLLRYSLRPCPRAPPPARLAIEKRGMFYMPGEPLHIQFIPRD